MLQCEGDPFPRMGVLIYCTEGFSSAKYRPDSKSRINDTLYLIDVSIQGPRYAYLKVAICSLITLD